MGKGKQFLGILKKYGVTEYWCDEDFDIDEEHPYNEIVIPTKNWDVIREIRSLYNDYSDDDLSHLTVWGVSSNDSLFVQYTQDKEKRIVS